MLTFARPPLREGEQLAAEIAAAGYNEVAVTDAFRSDGGDPPAAVEVLEVRALNGSGAPIGEEDRAAIQVVLDAHDPEVVRADRFTLPADGVTAATITYRRRTAPDPVTWTINGAAFDVPLDAEGAAVATITSSTPGPIEVKVGTRSLTLYAD